MDRFDGDRRCGDRRATLPDRSTRVRAPDATDVEHPQSWVAARRGPRASSSHVTAVSDVTLLLVAHDGEGGRGGGCRRSAGRTTSATATRSCRTTPPGIGILQRMRDYNRRKKLMGSSPPIPRGPGRGRPAVATATPGTAGGDVPPRTAGVERRPGDVQGAGRPAAVNSRRKPRLANSPPHRDPVAGRGRRSCCW